MKKLSVFVLVLVAATIILVSMSRYVLPISTNPCSSCHATYIQNLDFQEGDPVNQIPTTIIVSETKEVIIVIENICNAVHNTVMKDLVVILISQNGHFSVDKPICRISTLPVGTVNATWIITGTSAGPDALLLTAKSNNTHKAQSFTDTYSLSPSINVIDSPVAEYPVIFVPVIVTATVYIWFKKVK